MQLLINKISGRKVVNILKKTTHHSKTGAFIGYAQSLKLNAFLYS